MHSSYRALFFPCAFLIGALVLSACDAVQDTAPNTTVATPAEAAPLASAGVPLQGGHVIVANRASGTVSVLDARTDAVVATIPLPQGVDEPQPEPMYVVYSATTDRVFVGDRANNRVVAFDARTGAVEGTAPASGIFHMWADLFGSQLWVVDNVNNALTVIDVTTLSVLATVSVTGGVPHDVTVDPANTFAYATVFVTDAPDQVVKYSTSSFTEVDRTDVGEDPHLAVMRSADRLYVPCQGTSEVVVLERSTLDEVTSISVPAAHGAWMRFDDHVFFTTNISGGGTDGLFAINTSSNTVAGSTDTRPGDVIPTPHNVTATPAGRKVFIAHSGSTANQVTTYTVERNTPTVLGSNTVEVGLNPFGIGYVPPSVPMP